MNELLQRAANVYSELSDVFTDEDRWTQTHFLKARNIISELSERIAVLGDERLRDENTAILLKENEDLRNFIAELYRGVLMAEEMAETGGGA